MSDKRVYTFGNGKAEGNAKMREELGGKGANLAEMNLIGVPVPPGFTITTSCCNEYYEAGQEIELRLPESGFSGYMRWYDYETNGDPYYNGARNN